MIKYDITNLQFNENGYIPSLRRTKFNKVAFFQPYYIDLFENVLYGTTTQILLNPTIKEAVNKLLYYPITCLPSDYTEFVPGYNKETSTEEGSGIIIDRTKTGIPCYLVNGEIEINEWYTNNNLTTLFNKTYGNYLDDYGYTHITLLLPFTEPIEINQDLFDKTFNIDYSIDYANGDLTWYIGTTNSNNKKYYIYVKTINIAIEIPLGYTDNQNLIRNQINTILSSGFNLVKGVGGALSGQPNIAMSGAMGLIGNAQSMLTTALQDPVYRQEQPKNLNKLHQYKEPILIIDKPIAEELINGQQMIDNFYYINGYPIDEIGTIEDIPTKCKNWIKDVRFSSISMLDNEISELKNLLLSVEGVYFSEY